MIKRNKKILIIMAMAIAMLTTGCTSDKAVVEEPLKEIASEGELDTNEGSNTIIDEDCNLIREDGELKRCETEEVKYTKEHILVTDIEFLDEKLTEPNEKGEAFYQFKVKNNSKFILNGFGAIPEKHNGIYTYGIIMPGETSNEYKIPVKNVKNLDELKPDEMYIHMISEDYETVDVHYDYSTKEHNATLDWKFNPNENPDVKITDLEFIDYEIKIDEKTNKPYLQTRIKNNSDKVINQIKIDFWCNDDGFCDLTTWMPLKPGETSEILTTSAYGTIEEKLEELEVNYIFIDNIGNDGQEVMTTYFPKLKMYFNE